MIQPTKNTRLLTAWAALRQPGTVIQPHTHDFYELVYYKKGSGDSRIGAHCHSIQPGSFVLIPPGAEHAELHTSLGDLFCIGFQTSEPLPPLNLSDPGHTVRQVGSAILRETSEQNPYYDQMALLKLQELVLELLRMKHPGAKSTSKSFEYVINYLAQNYHEKIILKDLARQLHLSYDYFQHRFRELTGVSPQQFLVKQRLEASLRLLKESSFTCTEIAYRCGFSNSAQFSALFKREYGVSPRNYQRS